MDFNLSQPKASEVLLLHSNHQRRLCVQQNSQHRWLTIDEVVQSVMSLRDPNILCLPHQQIIANLLPDAVDSILELGLGGGDLTRYFEQRFTPTRHHCVELDGQILDIYQRYFQAPDQMRPHPTLYHDDAIAFIAKHQTRYQLIVLDLFSQEGNPLALFQAQTYQHLARCLQGDLFINLLPRTALELEHARQLCERWIGPATRYSVPGFINTIIHVTTRGASDL